MRADSGRGETWIESVSRACRGTARQAVFTMEKLFCPRADERPPPSAADILESPLGKGIVMERFRRGTTDDMAAADDRIWAASGVWQAA